MESSLAQITTANLNQHDIGSVSPTVHSEQHKKQEEKAAYNKEEEDKWQHGPNAIIYNVKEAEGEYDGRKQENDASLVASMVRDMASLCQIREVKRLGKTSNTDRPRPIMITCGSATKRENLISNIRALKGNETFTKAKMEEAKAKYQERTDS